jgi:hypothetical protein
MTKICANPKCDNAFDPGKFTPWQKYCCVECKRVDLFHKWYKKNSARKAVTERLWRLSNPDKEKNRHLSWRRSNPDRSLNQRTRRRALKSGAIGEHYTREQFRDLCSLAGNICLCCGRAKRLTADHVIPLSKGGSDSIDNIQPLCINCNSSKGIQIVDYRT